MALVGETVADAVTPCIDRALADVAAAMAPRSRRQPLEGQQEIMVAVCESLRSFPDDVRVQRPGCEALADYICLAAGPCPNGARPPSASELRQRAGLASSLVDHRQLMLNAMQSLPEDPWIHWHGCRAIAAFSDVGSADPLWETSLMALISSMSHQPDSIGIQWHGCEALASLSGDTVIKRMIYDTGAYERVLSAMIALPEERGVQFHACRALSELARRHEGSGSCSSDDLDFRACQQVLKAMHAFPDDPDLRWQGCDALVCLARNAGDDLAQQFVHLGTCVTVATALSAGCDQEGLRSLGCSIIARLSAVGREAVRQLVLSGACEVVSMTAARAYPEDVQLWSYCIQCFANLAVGDNADALVTESRQRLLRSGAVDSCVQALGLAIDAPVGWEADACEHVRRGSVVALGYLSQAGPEVLVQKNMDTLLARAMRSGPKDWHVQRWGCEIIATLASASLPHRRRFLEDGTSEAVLEAMRTFMKDREALFHAFTALASCCRNDPDAQRQLVNIGACEAS
eukprot:TRINITY_DN21174_c0_g1_i1.p1 TRINITY_DN21174_c0_g1~~TRINITY_DN21174_c0_g1_i1.p1  ORF type:complete len:517 (+),score=45.24 TRINITY_DN21174_c0_g1_i1:126-1676(+)